MPAAADASGGGGAQSSPSGGGGAGEVDEEQFWTSREAEYFARVCPQLLALLERHAADSEKVLDAAASLFRSRRQIGPLTPSAPHACEQQRFSVWLSSEWLKFAAGLAPLPERRQQPPIVACCCVSPAASPTSAEGTAPGDDAAQTGVLEEEPTPTSAKRELLEATAAAEEVCCAAVAEGDAASKGEDAPSSCCNGNSAPLQEDRQQTCQDEAASALRSSCAKEANLSCAPAAPEEASVFSWIPGAGHSSLRSLLHFRLLKRGAECVSRLPPIQYSREAASLQAAEFQAAAAALAAAQKRAAPSFSPSSSALASGGRGGGGRATARAQRRQGLRHFSGGAVSSSSPNAAAGAALFSASSSSSRAQQQTSAVASEAASEASPPVFDPLSHKKWGGGEPLPPVLLHRPPDVFALSLLLPANASPADFPREADAAASQAQMLPLLADALTLPDPLSSSSPGESPRSSVPEEGRAGPGLSPSPPKKRMRVPLLLRGPMPGWFLRRRRSSQRGLGQQKCRRKTAAPPEDPLSPGEESALPVYAHSYLSALSASERRRVFSRLRGDVGERATSSSTFAEKEELPTATEVSESGEDKDRETPRSRGASTAAQTNAPCRAWPFPPEEDFVAAEDAARRSGELMLLGFQPDASAFAPLKPQLAARRRILELQSTDAASLSEGSDDAESEASPGAEGDADDGDERETDDFLALSSRRRKRPLQTEGTSSFSEDAAPPSSFVCQEVEGGDALSPIEVEAEHLAWRLVFLLAEKGRV